MRTARSRNKGHYSYIENSDTSKLTVTVNSDGTIEFGFREDVETQLKNVDTMLRNVAKMLLTMDTVQEEVDAMIPNLPNVDAKMYKNLRVSQQYRNIVADYYNSLSPEDQASIRKNLCRHDFEYAEAPTKMNVKQTYEHLLHFKVYSVFLYTEGEGLIAHHFLVLFMVGTLNGEFTHTYLSMEKFDDCLVFIEAKEATDIVCVRPARKKRLFVSRNGANLVGCVRVLADHVTLNDHLNLIDDENDFGYSLLFNNCSMFARKFMRFYHKLSDTKTCDEKTMTQYNAWIKARFKSKAFLRSLEASDKGIPEMSEEERKQYHEQRKQLSKDDDAKVEKIIQEITKRKKRIALQAHIQEVKEKLKSCNNEEDAKDWELACLIWDSGACEDYFEEPQGQSNQQVMKASTFNSKESLKSSLIKSKKLLKASNITANQIQLIEENLNEHLTKM